MTRDLKLYLTLMQPSYPNYIVIPEQQVETLISCSKGHQHRIIPIQLSDGRYVISSDVLNESSGIFSHIFAKIDLSQFEQIGYDEVLENLPIQEEEDVN